MSIRVVLATANRHKVEEFHSILGEQLPGLEIVAYDGPSPREDGLTFSENALIKARAAAEKTGLPALADDSGLCVDVLGGAPGVFSARWAGRTQNDQANRDLLLEQLADIAQPHRGAQFVCHIACVIPQRATLGNVEHSVGGRWAGRLTTEATGEHGFGYDPIFVPDGFAVTVAQLDPKLKNQISHRSLAFSRLIPILRAELA